MSVPLPRTSELLVDPVPTRLTVPCRTSIPETVFEPTTVTLNEPVAAVPAENTANCPAGQPDVDASPVALGLQFASTALHVPLGVVPPAPGVAPSMSQ